MKPGTHPVSFVHLIQQNVTRRLESQGINVFYSDQSTYKHN
jgi:hypothetical protein